MKAIIAGMKSLIAMLSAGGVLAIIAVVLICLIALFSSSIFGIFLSSEKTDNNAISMNEIVTECNQEFSNKLQNIQDTNPHEEFVLDGNMASWKDILLIYTAKESNGLNQHEVLTIDNNKKNLIKEIFWEMNSVSSSVQVENVTHQGTNIDEKPIQLQKKVLHIKITNKNLQEMISKYNFNPLQLNQLKELSNNKYNGLWNGVIYGYNDNGDYFGWRQKGASWSNIRIGNTTSTIGDIGCLVTSIAILIDKSGVNVEYKPFNPGVFVEQLNKNHGFDNKGNLQYFAVTKVVPNFKYVGNINLRGKTRNEKLSLIKQYYNAGYFLTIEVKGATKGNQHWVALADINNNNLIMVDPGSNHRDIWSAYEYSNTSQFNYFKAY